MKERRGFTLIELLIVLLVLGVLSGVTIFSTLSIATTADADKIIKDMLMLRTATLMWYKENSSRVVYDDDSNQYKIMIYGIDKPKTFDYFVKNHRSEILKYLNNEKSIDLLDTQSNVVMGNYVLLAVDNDRKWYVCCYLGQLEKTARGEEAPDVKVREKIAGRTKKSKSSGTDSIELFGIDNLDPQSVETPYSGQKFVCMQILELAAR